MHAARIHPEGDRDPEAIRTSPWIVTAGLYRGLLAGTVTVYCFRCLLHACCYCAVLSLPAVGIPGQFTACTPRAGAR